MAKSILTWENVATEAFAGPAPFLNICDNVESYCASLNGLTIAQAVDDFVAGYDRAEGATEADVREEIEIGFFKEMLKKHPQGCSCGAPDCPQHVADMAGAEYHG